MGMILLGIAAVIEIVFCVWALWTKDRHDLEKVIVRGGGAVLILLLVAVGLLEGMFRYGGFVIVLLLQALIGYLLWRKKKEREVKPVSQILKIFGNTILYLCVLLIAVVFPQHKEPVVTGNHEVAIKEFTWVDESRVETFTDTGENRAVTVKIWYPKEDGSYPLAVFSHGAFGIIDSNSSTCMELASNGYVAVSIVHPYHALFVKDTSGKITTIDPNFLNRVYADNGADTPEAEQRVYEFSKEWLKLRTDDENFVLDTLINQAKTTDEAPFNEINIDKIGLFGHSMGGATSEAVGRQREDIDAVIDIEGTMSGDYMDFSLETGKYTYNSEPYPIPLLDINSKEIYDAANALPVEYVNFYVGERAKDFHEVVFDNAGHLNFTDLAVVSPILAKKLGSGSVDAKTCIENLNAVVLNFFDYYVKGEGELTIQKEY